MSSFLYMVSYFDNSTQSVDHIVFRSSSLKILFDEIIDLLGDDANLYQVERMTVTDLDVMYLDDERIDNYEL